MAIFIRCETHCAYVSIASGTLRVFVNLFAKSDHSVTSDRTRASQTRLASSYAARRSFCKANAASVRTCPQLRNACASAAGGETVWSFIAMTQYLFQQITK